MINNIPIVPGRGTKQEVPRIDFQVREESASKSGSNGKGRGVQAVLMPAATITKPPQGSAVEQNVEGGVDGKITIVLKNSKIVDISMAPELLMKIFAGSIKMQSMKDGNEPMFAIDVAKEGHDKADYKLPGLTITGNRALGGTAEDDGVHEGQPTAPNVSELDFEPGRLPAVVVVRNKAGEDPIFYGKIEEHAGHKVMTPVRPEEVKSSDSTIYELIRMKAVNT